MTTLRLRLTLALLAAVVATGCEPLDRPEIMLAAIPDEQAPRPPVVRERTDTPLVVREEVDTVAEEPSASEAPARASHAVRSGERFPRPEHVRGLYLNAWASGSRNRTAALIDLARRTEINTFVIDIKDASGYVSHRTSVELAHQVGATGERRISDLPGLLDRLEAAGIYPIARIVIVKDPILTAYRPEYAIQDTAGGVWVDSKGITWLNPYSRGVWDYHVDLAREVAEMGFPEIQWDYVRFPDAPDADLARAVYRGADGRDRVQAIRSFLRYSRERLADLNVLVTADVFGVTTSYRSDIGIGQVWEDFIDVVDAALPMVYPSHYWPGSFGYRHPNGRPYEVVYRALTDALRRSSTVEGAGRTIPWLQDFTLGPPVYAGAEVRAQIQATYDAGIREWILWNPGSRYTEAALEPAGGFENEPLVRVAGVLTPVSRRHFVIDSVAALPARADSARASEVIAPPTDTATVAPRVDSLATEARDQGTGQPVAGVPTDSARAPVEPQPADAPPPTDTLRIVPRGGL